MLSFKVWHLECFSVIMEFICVAMYRFSDDSPSKSIICLLELLLLL